MWQQKTGGQGTGTQNRGWDEGARKDRRDRNMELGIGTGRGTVGQGTREQMTGNMETEDGEQELVYKTGDGMKG